jgi:phosphonopyruvate decarboxylase
MIDACVFLDKLTDRGFNRLAGVPCSFLSALIIEAEKRGIYEPFVNEGDAMAYAAGCALAGQKCAVLMQNSGLTNALSPLSSLNELFKLHTLLIIGNRGTDDEPQHRIMATLVKPILDALAVPYFNAEDGDTAIDHAVASLDKHSAALLVNRGDTFFKGMVTKPAADLPLRYDILKAVADTAADAVIVTTTGFTSREMYCIKDKASNFYMVGSMGCVSSLASGIAESLPRKKVIAIDGDSACLMRLGGLYTLTRRAPKNLCYILLDNQANESTGGQANTKGAHGLFEVLSSMHSTKIIKTQADTRHAVTQFMANDGYNQLYIPIKQGSPDNLPRPERTLIFDQAKRFKAYCEEQI